MRININKERPCAPPPRTERASLKRYADAIALWSARFDTAEIAAQLKLEESVVARWVANFRDQVRAVEAAPLEEAA